MLHFDQFQGEGTLCEKITRRNKTKFWLKMYYTILIIALGITIHKFHVAAVTVNVNFDEDDNDDQQFFMSSIVIAFILYYLLLLLQGLSSSCL